MLSNLGIKKKFEKDGYIVLDLINKNFLLDIKSNLALLINNSYINNNIKINHNPNCLNSTINEGMINLESVDHKLLSNIYDTIPRSTFFLKLISSDSLTKKIKLLLNLKNKSNFYTNSVCMRMDVPGVTKFNYGWHIDENTNITGSNFIQLWAPMFENATKKNGALEIIIKSHKLKLETNMTKSEQEKLGKINRSDYNKVKFINKKGEKLISKHIPVRIGQVILFKKNLYHRSGIINESKMRYAMTSFYHDISDKSFTYENMYNFT